MAVTLQNMPYNPKSTATVNKGSSKGGQQPTTIKSAMSISAEQKKNAESMLTQELLNGMAKAIEVDPVFKIRVTVKWPEDDSIKIVRTGCLGFTVTAEVMEAA